MKNSVNSAQDSKENTPSCQKEETGGASCVVFFRRRFFENKIEENEGKDLTHLPYKDNVVYLFGAKKKASVVEKLSVCVKEMFRSMEHELAKKLSHSYQDSDGNKAS